MNISKSFANSNHSTSELYLGSLPFQNKLDYGITNQINDTRNNNKSTEEIEHKNTDYVVSSLSKTFKNNSIRELNFTGSQLNRLFLDVDINSIDRVLTKYATKNNAIIKILGDKGFIPINKKLEFDCEVTEIREKVARNITSQINNKLLSTKNANDKLKILESLCQNYYIPSHLLDDLCNISKTDPDAGQQIEKIMAKFTKYLVMRICNGYELDSHALEYLSKEYKISKQEMNEAVEIAHNLPSSPIDNIRLTREECVTILQKLFPEHLNQSEFVVAGSASYYLQSNEKERVGDLDLITKLNQDEAIDKVLTALKMVGYENVKYDNSHGVTFSKDGKEYSIELITTDGEPCPVYLKDNWNANSFTFVQGIPCVTDIYIPCRGYGITDNEYH